MEVILILSEAPGHESDIILWTRLTFFLLFDKHANDSRSHFLSTVVGTSPAWAHRVLAVFLRGDSMLLYFAKDETELRE